MKKFIASLELRFSDLFLLLAAGSFALFIGVGQSFMNQMDLNANMPLPMWIFTIFGIMMIVFFGLYLYIELFSKKEPYNKYVVMVFAFLILLNLVAVLVQPATGTEYVRVRFIPEGMTSPYHVGDLVPVNYQISAIHKLFFIFENIGMLLMIYSGLFVFPKRFKNLKFIEFLGYIMFAVCIFLAIYSYATEYNLYIGFIKYVTGIDRSSGDIGPYLVKSLFSHRNPLGMTYMLGIIFCYINHSFSKKWWHYLLAGFLFVNLIFTFCKTGILLSVLVTFIYVIYRLIATYKEHTKRNLITLISIGSIVVIAAIFVGVPYLTKGKILPSVYNLIQSITGGGLSLETRSYIWDNGFQIISNGWWLLGRGFGIPNLIVKPMNIISHGEDFISLHSGFLTVLTEGGLFYFLAYIAFLIYSGYVIIKSYKVDKDLTISVSLGVLTFLLYSLIESNHYLIYLFLFPIFILYYQREEKKVEEKSNEA